MTVSLPTVDTARELITQARNGVEVDIQSALAHLWVLVQRYDELNESKYNELEAAYKQVNDLQGYRDTIERDLEAKSEYAELLECEKHDLEVTLTRTDDAYDEKADQVRDLEMEVDRLEQENYELKEENARLQADNRFLERELSNYQR